VVVWSGHQCAQRPKSTGPTAVSHNPSTNHARHMGNRCGTPLPVCCRHGKIRSKSTEPASDSKNPSSNLTHLSHTHLSRMRLFQSFSCRPLECGQCPQECGQTRIWTGMDICRQTEECGWTHSATFSDKTEL